MQQTQEVKLNRVQSQLFEDEIKKIKANGHATCVKFTEKEFIQIKKVQLCTGETLPKLLKAAFFEKVTDFRPLMDRDMARAILKELRRSTDDLNHIRRELDKGFGYEFVKGFPEIADRLGEMRSFLVEQSTFQRPPKKKRRRNKKVDLSSHKEAPTAVPRIA